MLLQALHVEIVWERRSQPTTPLLAGLMLINSHLQHSLQLICALHSKHTWRGLRFTVRFAVLEFTLSL